MIYRHVENVRLIHLMGTTNLLSSYESLVFLLMKYKGFIID